MKARRYLAGTLLAFMLSATTTALRAGQPVGAPVPRTVRVTWDVGPGSQCRFASQCMPGDWIELYSYLR